MEMMDASCVDFSRYSVEQLRKYLQDRGVTCAEYRKHHLIRLAEVAHELNLEVLTADDFPTFHADRRTVNNRNGVSVTVADIRDVSCWFTALHSLPQVEIADIMVYVMHKCGWGPSRLRNYKKDNSWQLQQNGHISSVKLHEIPDCDFVYVMCDCTPETRQSEKPYSTWVLLQNDGQVRSGGCTCVA